MRAIIASRRPKRKREESDKPTEGVDMTRAVAGRRIEGEGGGAGGGTGGSGSGGAGSCTI